MNYLLTGCAGFIGYHVTLKLLERGDRVVGVDNLNDAYDVRLKEWRLQQLRARENFQFFKEDITDAGAMQGIYRSGRFEAVLNLAARAGVRASVENPREYYRTNVDGTLNLLECNRQFGVKKLLLASTSSVYGEAPTPFSEKSESARALSPYAAGKKAAEVLCYSYHYLYGMDILIPRFFSVYGPAGRPDMAYFKFLVKMDRGEEIEVYGDGSQARDFTYIDDVATGVVKSLELSGHHIFNLGNDQPVKLNDLIALLEKLSGKRARIKRLPRHRADNPITWADISHSRKLLGYAPQTALESGLQAVVEWFAENREWVQQLSLSS